jgi:type I restriction-modification system DNA methylase subunit/predicted DNA-binding transcriptional regulator AlpA
VDDDDALVSLADVAEMAGVTRPAVSNWRRRNRGDFPQPVEETGTTSLFRLGDIRAWMRKHHKQFDVRSVDQLVWSALNPERGAVLPEEAAREGMVLLAYLALARRLDSGRSLGLHAVIGDEDPQSLTRFLTDLDLRAQDHRLSEVFPARLATAWPRASRPFLVKLFDLAIEHGISETFDALIPAVGRGARGESDHTTPAGVVELIMSLASPVAGAVIDPACGYGTLLVAASKAADAPLRLIGQDIDGDACDIARMRTFVHGLAADISQGDTLEAKGIFSVPAAINEVEADLVVADPSLGMSWTPHPAIEDLMPYGIPPASRPAMAWIQGSINRLRPGGSALLILGNGATFRGGKEGEIRQRLIESRSVRAVVTLPPALYPTASIPVSLWVLTKPDDYAPRLSGDRLLLVDASRLGKRRGKTRAELTAPDVTAITACVRDWQTNEQITAENGVRAAAVPIGTLLAAGGNLNPARWVEDGAVDPERVLRRIAAAKGELCAAAAAFRSDISSLPSFEVEPVKESGSSQAMIRVADLAVIVRPRRIDPDLVGTGETPLIRVHDIGPGLSIAPSGQVDAEPIADRIDVTQPGDIVVVTDGAKPRAAVDPVGGAAVSAPLQIVRPWPGAMDAVVLAALISSIVPRYASGTAITHVDLAALEIPIPDPETAKRLGKALVELGSQRHQAMIAVEAIDELSAGLVDALISPALRLAVSAADHEKQQRHTAETEP